METSTKLKIIGVLFLAALIIGALFYTNSAKKLTSWLPISQIKSPAGLDKAQMITKTYPQLVKRAFIQQKIEGTLKAASDKSWTVEKAGQTLTLTNEGINKVRYFKIEKSATSSAQPTPPKEIPPQAIKIGDLVAISQTIDWESGNTMVVSVTLIPPENKP